MSQAGNTSTYVKIIAKAKGLIDALPSLIVIAMIFILSGAALYYYDSPGPKFWQKDPIIIIDNFTGGTIEVYVDEKFVGEYSSFTKLELSRVSKNYIKINNGKHSIKIIDKKTKTILNNELKDFKKAYWYLLNAGNKVVYKIGKVAYGGYHSVGYYKQYIYELSKSNTYYFKSSESLPKSIKRRKNSNTVYKTYFTRHRIEGLIKQVELDDELTALLLLARLPLPKNN